MAEDSVDLQRKAESLRRREITMLDIPQFRADVEGMVKSYGDQMTEALINIQNREERAKKMENLDIYKTVPSLKSMNNPFFTAYTEMKEALIVYKNAMSWLNYALILRQTEVNKLYAYIQTFQDKELRLGYLQGLEKELKLIEKAGRLEDLLKRTEDIARSIEARLRDADYLEQRFQASTKRVEDKLKSEESKRAFKEAATEKVEETTKMEESTDGDEDDD